MKRGDDSGYNDTRESGIVHDAGYHPKIRAYVTREGTNV